MAVAASRGGGQFTGADATEESERKSAQKSSLLRTSTGWLQVRCVERDFKNKAKRRPVKLVVFDFDETLTLSTFVPRSWDLDADQTDFVVSCNFGSPYLEGRVEKLRRLLARLVAPHYGEPQRLLAVLTRNEAGLIAVMKLLEAANLLEYFTALWALTMQEDVPLGAYKDDGEWLWFDPPQDSIHKADVISEIIAKPDVWFPQLAFSSGAALKARIPTCLEEVVLVDDQRTAFQSSMSKLLRFVKVARFDGLDPRPEADGAIRSMGGIGAHSEADYERIYAFVQEPWHFEDQLQLMCAERAFASSSLRRPVKLVVFGFDETLTLATFMPPTRECASEIGWCPSSSSTSGAYASTEDYVSEDADDWSTQELLEYNFESPYVLGGERVMKLRSLLQDLTTCGGQNRKLAILSRNLHGAIAILNLLKLADLADNFSAIWVMQQHKEDKTTGLYRTLDGDWEAFQPPFEQVQKHKADILHHIAHNPGMWLPGLDVDRPWAAEEVVLVDDQREHFRSTFATGREVIRYCKVARYDDEYRDCGFLNMLGGIGARSNSDFEALRQFVSAPWDFHVAAAPLLNAPGGTAVEILNTSDGEEPAKIVRKRSHKLLHCA